VALVREAIDLVTEEVVVEAAFEVTAFVVVVVVVVVVVATLEDVDDEDDELMTELEEIGADEVTTFGVEEVVAGTTVAVEEVEGAAEVVAATSELVVSVALWYVLSTQNWTKNI
jgi:hypothetical protein